MLSLYQKILNNSICRLCLSEDVEKLFLLDDIVTENGLSSSDLIEKFNVVEVN